MISQLFLSLFRAGYGEELELPFGLQCPARVGPARLVHPSCGELSLSLSLSLSMYIYVYIYFYLFIHLFVSMSLC